MINSEISMDKTTAKWGYEIYTGNLRGNEEVKILKILEYKFDTEKEAIIESQIELDKFNDK